MLDSKPEARDSLHTPSGTRQQGHPHTWGHGAEGSRWQEKFHAGRMTNHIQGPKKTDGGQRELAATGGGNGKAMAGEALLDGVCSVRTHRSQAITWRKEAPGKVGDL